MRLLSNIKKRLKKQIINLVKEALFLGEKRYNYQVEQKNFILNTIALKNQKVKLPPVSEMGFKIYSQYEEDGMLLYIFTLIGVTNKKVVEICAGNGQECMATNLIVNHGWDGLLFDGDEQNVSEGMNFFSSNIHTRLMPPKFIHAWITKSNINDLIQNNGFIGEIDLLSIDIDGNDYHILKNVNVVKPRVIICEVHNVIPAEHSLTIPYTEDFDFKDGRQPQDYRSASLLAMYNLLKNKGYRLIACNKYGFNAIFIRSDLGLDLLPSILVEEALNNKYSEYRREEWNKIKHLIWENV